MGAEQTDIEEIFNAARQISNPSERSAYLDRACGANAALRARLNKLLAAVDEGGSSVEIKTPESAPPTADETAPPAATVTSMPLSEKPGTVIGRYKLLQLIGEGGFGSVYMAEQQEPVHRKVALKIIKLGMDTRQVIARFEAERQALAMMDHPNIARVFDAGATETGRPYFVMELVKGVPITKYCDENNLSTKDRLDLFMLVCHAIQHAHQKGIIHRDVKPSNVMVTLHDGKPMPKVIDFGIAKATDHRLTEKTLFTEFRQLVGTPAYMSPEQAEMTGLDVDTRSDIYSLGVLLYELLTGTTPFKSTMLRQAAFGEIQRIIREMEPPRPSTRLSTLGDELTDVARHRRTEPKTLSRLVRGDLDWIVMKALEKDRTRRYATAAEFADDVGRHLRHEPVTAGPPAISYRARKFVRRNRGAVVATAIVMLVVLGFGIVMAIQARRNQILADRERAAKEEAVVERARAEAAEAEATKKAEEALVAAEKAEAITRFLQKMIARIDPVRMAADDIAQLHRRPHDVTVREVLDEASRTIDVELQDKPAVQAAVRDTMARTYEGLGLWSSAHEHLAWLIDYYKRERGEQDEKTLWTMHWLGAMAIFDGRDEEAIRVQEETLTRARTALGQDHSLTIATMVRLGNAYRTRGMMLKAEPLLEQAYDRARRLHSEDWRLVTKAAICLGFLRRSQGRLVEAERLSLEYVELHRRELGLDDPWTIHGINVLEFVYTDQGKSAQREEYRRETLARCRRVLGDEHPQTVAALRVLGGTLQAKGDWQHAAEVYHEAVTLSRGLGEDNPQLTWSLEALASVLQESGKPAQAREVAEELLEIRRRKLGAHHPLTVGCLRWLSRLTWAAGDRGATGEYAREWISALKDACASSTAGAQEWNEYAWVLLTVEPRGLRDAEAALVASKVAVEKSQRQDPLILDTLALAYETAGELDKAIETQEEAFQLLPRGKPNSIEVIASRLVELYERKEDPGAITRIRQATEQKYRQAAADLQTSDQSPPEDVASALVWLGRKLLESGDCTQAESVLRRCLELRRSIYGEGSWLIPNTVSTLGEALVCLGRFEEAEPLIVTSYAELRDYPFSESWAGVRALEALARVRGLYTSWGRPKEYRVQIDASIARSAASAKTLNAHARRLLTCKRPELRDPEVALIVAQESASRSGNKDSDILDTLALAYWKNGNVDAAITTQKLALSLVDLHDADKRWTLDTRLMEFVKAKGDPGLTQEIYGQRVAWLRTQLPHGKAELANSLRMLGDALLEDGEFEQAESALLESWGLLGEERSNGVDGSPRNSELVQRTRELLDCIIRLYDSWDEAKPATGMAGKAATWRTTRSTLESEVGADEP